MASPSEPGPVIPAEVTLPEITVKAVILSVVLAAVLAGANAYLGLFAGMTVSASIPAAVVSMAVLRLFRESNILENNIVQTAASSGEALAAGVIFTIPALLLIGYWTSFDYGQTAAIAMVGGLLGVLFTIPLRRGLIVTERLRYPEGIATAEVLKVGSGGETAVAGFRTSLSAAIIGGLGQTGEWCAGCRYGNGIPRTDYDAPLLWVLVPFGLVLVPMALIYHAVVRDGIVALVMTVLMAGAAFLFSAVAAYMAGLVGSSSNPVSGVTIATIGLTALVLVPVMGGDHPAGPAAARLIGAAVCCAAAMGGDNLQDLKTGYVVGSTPWKQQIMQVVGVATAAVVIVPVLVLLQAKYGIGEVTADHPHPLSAPQAMLMASLARGVFGGTLPGEVVGLGVDVGVASIR